MSEKAWYWRPTTHTARRQNGANGKVYLNQHRLSGPNGRRILVADVVEEKDAARIVECVAACAGLAAPSAAIEHARTALQAIGWMNSMTHEEARDLARRALALLSEGGV